MSLKLSRPAAALALAFATIVGGALAVQGHNGASPASDLEYVIAQDGQTYGSIARDLDLSCTGAELNAANRKRVRAGLVVLIPPSCQGHVVEPPTTEPPTTEPPTTEPPTTEPPTTEPPTTEPPAPVTGFPTRATTGVPAGWVPQQTIYGNYFVRDAGTVVEDIRVVEGKIIVDAPNVTIRRVELVGGGIDNFYGPDCDAGLLVEDTSFVLPPGGRTSWEPVLLAGSFTARRVMIDGMPEGIRAGGVGLPGCGPILIEDSWVRAASPVECNNNDWHGDGLQGYGGPPVTIRNSYFELDQTPDCGGTAPFFYPSNQGNTSVDIDGLIVNGGGYPFRLGMPGPVRNLHIVDGSWNFGPIEVRCSVVTDWSASISTLDANGQPVPVRSQPCNTDDG